jgi:hypothetical protein
MISMGRTNKISGFQVQFAPQAHPRARLFIALQLDRFFDVGDRSVVDNQNPFNQTKGEKK